MSNHASDHNALLRVSLLGLLITGLLLLYAGHPKHPAVAPQFDNLDSPLLVFDEGSGDSPSPDTLAALAASLTVAASASGNQASPSLGFVRPVQRLVSQPLLPQGPPVLA